MSGDERSASVTYRVEYRYEPFVDAKHPERRRPDGVPSWARIGFEIVCPQCGQTRSASTQNNLVRPLECRCGCGSVLYTEEREIPVLALVSTE